MSERTEDTGGDGGNEQEEQALAKPQEQEEVPETHPLIPDEVLRALPDEQRIVLIRAISAQVSQHHVSQIANPILGQVTSEHIDKIIDNAGAEDVRQHDTGTSIRRYLFASFAVLLLFVVVLVVFLRDEPEILFPTLTLLTGLGGGGLGGYGLGRRG